ncbi:phage tail protein [Cellulosilyticum sp. I15G10I2]|uniref:phage tail protein n=1 Tax=Cellulosilyticum sp. I15G10I2 TaxID=1892843 RepID=UPI00085BE70B|nr:phage tail protein [Cellulosilyticum sp. I15G10I2]
MNLNQLDLLSLQTNSMKSDKTTVALCEAINPQLNAIDVTKCIISSNIDTMSDAMLDEIATEKNIFWYDPNAEIEIKRNLIKNCDKVFSFLGTNYAIEQVIKDYFGDGVIEEWYEYGGAPYHFKVLTSNISVTGEKAEQFNAAVNKVKRLSTRLEEVLVNMVADLSVHYGFVLHTGDSITLIQGA